MSDRQLSSLLEHRTTNFLIALAVPHMILPENLNLWGTFVFFAACAALMSFGVLYGEPHHT